MPIIRLGIKNTPLDWSELQRRAKWFLGRQLRVPCAENKFVGDNLSRSELRAIGFKVAANPGRYLARSVQTFTVDDSIEGDSGA